MSPSTLTNYYKAPIVRQSHLGRQLSARVGGHGRLTSALIILVPELETECGPLPKKMVAAAGRFPHIPLRNHPDRGGVVDAAKMLPLEIASKP